MVEVCLLIRGKALEKLAVLELSTYFIKMQQVEVIRNKSFAITNELVMPINLLKDFYNDIADNYYNSRNKHRSDGPMIVNEIESY